MMADQGGNLAADGTARQPDEDWRQYVERLEKARLEAIANHRLKEAEALEKVTTHRLVAEIGEEHHMRDIELKVEARAKRAYVKEFLKVISEMEDGAER